MSDEEKTVNDQQEPDGIEPELADEMKKFEEEEIGRIMQEQENLRTIIDTIKSEPIADNIVVLPDENDDELTPGGIILPSHGGKTRPQKGVVVAVGPGRVESGVRHPLQMSWGDHVIFGRGHGIPVRINGLDLLVMREEHVLVILESTNREDES